MYPVFVMKNNKGIKDISQAVNIPLSFELLLFLNSPIVTFYFSQSTSCFIRFIKEFSFFLILAFKLFPKPNTYACDSILSYTVLGNRQITSISKHSGYSS